MQDRGRPLQEVREGLMENILITGALGGIGKAVAEELLAAGASVIGLGRTESAEAGSLRERYPGKFAFYPCDLTDTDSLSGLIKTIVAESGPIGGFVHCAGYDKMAPLHMNQAADYEGLWRLHALVPMLMIGEISKKKNHRENTGIVLISSQSAHEGAMGHTAYAAAKGALEGYLAPAAAELMEKGIRINEVCFGPVKTPMADGWMSKLTEEGRKKLEDSYPLGLGETEDAANLICFLLSEKARWINGQIVTADGGHAVRKT